MTQCAKIIVGFVANVGNVFYPTFTNVSYIFSTLFYVFNVFLFSSQRLLHLCCSQSKNLKRSTRAGFVKKKGVERFQERLGKMSA